MPRLPAALLLIALVGGCGGSSVPEGTPVSVRLATNTGSSGEVDYGPCRWPEAIEPVRLLMHTLLRRRLAAERRCECP